MKAAVVNGATVAIGSIIAAVLGAGAIIYQIGRQAGNAIRQTRHNETLRLRLDIYKDIISLCRTSSDAEVDMSSLIRLFHPETVIFKQIEKTGIQAAIPKARVPTLIEKKMPRTLRLSRLSISRRGGGLLIRASTSSDWQQRQRNTTLTRHGGHISTLLPVECQWKTAQERSSHGSLQTTQPWRRLA
jgi:hypothetical protein